MSKQNVQLVQRGLTVFNQGTLDELFALVDEIADPEVELRAVGRLPDVSAVRGHEAVKYWLAQMLETLDYQLEPEEFIDAGDAVVVPTPRSQGERQAVWRRRTGSVWCLELETAS